MILQDFHYRWNGHPILKVLHINITIPMATPSRMPLYSRVHRFYQNNCLKLIVFVNISTVLDLMWKGRVMGLLSKESCGIRARHTRLWAGVMAQSNLLNEPRLRVSDDLHNIKPELRILVRSKSYLQYVVAHNILKQKRHLMSSLAAYFFTETNWVKLGELFLFDTFQLLQTSALHTVREADGTSLMGIDFNFDGTLLVSIDTVIPFHLYDEKRGWFVIGRCNTSLRSE